MKKFAFPDFIGKLFAGLAFLLASTSIYAQTTLFFDDFENGFKNWLNTNGDSTDWLVNKNGTPSSNTGPLSGANGSNYYLYFETSSGYAYYKSDSALLLSPTLTNSNIHLKFYYHMYGGSIGDLSVDIFDGSKWILDVWKVSGQQQTSSNSDYKLQDLDLSPFTVKQIRLRAVAAGGFMGDTAIDSLEIYTLENLPSPPSFIHSPLSKADAPIHLQYKSTLTGDAVDPNGDSLIFDKTSGPAWLEVSPQGDLTGIPNNSDLGNNIFEISASDGIFSSITMLNINVVEKAEPVVISQADFETDMGNWTNTLAGDSNDWIRNSGGTPSLGTGPSSGAENSIYYLYLETSSGFAYSAGNNAILLSPAITEDNILLTFNYHMYGSNAGSLSVDILSNGSWINDIWKISGQQQTSNSSPYLSAIVDLSTYTVNQIRLRATAVGGYMGDTAVDNLKIQSTPKGPDDSDLDGVIDYQDTCPNTPLGEATDSTGCSNSQQDSDGDGFVNSIDAFPQNPDEWADTDLDGVGNNADLDDDNDGIADINDIFPLDSNEFRDTDQDGIGDNADQDDDNDSIPDYLDAFPLDSSESIDTDGDGIGNNADTDDDGDGILDIEDAFPLDATEWIDSDGDGQGNNSDTDDDNDGILDLDETQTYNTNPLSPDTDLDKLPDNWEVQHQLDPLFDDAQLDADQDGYTNLEEYEGSSDPRDAQQLPLEKIQSLSLSSNMSCGIIKSKIECWGNYPATLLAVNPTITPVQVGIANDAYICALENNIVSCWSSLASPGTLVTELLSQPITNAKSLSTAALNATACIIDQSELVKCWGSNAYGLASPPTNIYSAKQISMFGNHACAHNNNNVSCWGNNMQHQLDAPSDIKNPIKVSVGGLHSCALQADGLVRCWGDNSSNQLNIPTNIGNVIDIASGFYHTCILNKSGKVVCWGSNAQSQIDTPVDLPAATEIFAGPYNVCANTVKGMVCWGRNTYGESSIWYRLKDFAVGENHVCGITNSKIMCFGSKANEPSVYTIPSGILEPKVIGAGRFHTCVWASSGMHCWGKNDSQQLQFPATLSNVTEIGGGTYHTCVIDNGIPKCWGSNHYSLLNTPSILQNPTHNLSSGIAHNCVIDGDSASCWGDNYYNQSQTHTFSDLRDIAAGGLYPYPNSANSGYTCAANKDGVTCWGSSQDGTLSPPAGLNNVKKLYAGWGFACALKDNGSVSCWGNLINNAKDLDIGDVTQIKGYTSKACSRNQRKLVCTSGSAILLN